MEDQDVPVAAPNSTMGDPTIINALVELLRNGQGQNITMMVQEAISKVVQTPITPFSTSNTMPIGISRVVPPSTHLVGMPDTIMPSNTSNVTQKDFSRCVMPSTPITRVTSSTTPRSMPSTSNVDAPSIAVEMDIHAPIRSTPRLVNNPSSVRSVRVLPPTPEQVSLRSLMESQSRMLRLLPDTLENDAMRKELLKQIELCERTLLGSGGLTSAKQEINEEVTDVPTGASTSTPKTSTISLVTTKGTQEVTILLSSEGNALKDEMGGGAKRHLRNTTKATQARVSSIKSHKLGSGGYNSIRGGLVYQFEKEASEEDLKYALLHGSEGLRKHLLDQGEKLVIGHEFEEAQQPNSSNSEREVELEEEAELFVVHNDSTVISEPQHETILEFQPVGNNNNDEVVQCDEQSTPTITIVPHRKRTQRKRMEEIQC